MPGEDERVDKWLDRIPKVIRVILGVTATLATTALAVMAWMFMTFETTDASEQKWIQHNQAIACQTVFELKGEIRRYLERLRWDKSLTESDRRWLEAEIRALEEQVRRIDPDGRC